MKRIEIKERINFTVNQVWSVVGTIDRFDWVPGIDSIEINDDLRIFSLKPIGHVVERIIERNDGEFKLVYSAIESPAKLDHHLASITLLPQEDQCQFHWISEIDPPEYAGLILNSMNESYLSLCAVLTKEFN